MKDSSRITKKIDRDSVYYVLYWSEMKKADKYEIITSVPAVAGIYELYYMDDRKKLNLFYVAKCWYGGLRHHIRMDTDAETEQDEKRKKIVDEHDCYYRYAVHQSLKDMEDILYFFARTYFPASNKVSSSGRYTNIFVKEISPNKIITV
ncbi:MAG: hypothetical protein JW969_19480 [Spirochaetales bacterium]|nr:hypothetical protein [Spirochaetales bacterium]